MWSPFTVTFRDVPRYDPEFLREERDEMGEAWFAQEYGVEFRDDLTSTDRRNPLLVAPDAVEAMFQ